MAPKTIEDMLGVLRNLPLNTRAQVWAQVRAETPMGQNPTPELVDSVLASYYLQQSSQPEATQGAKK